MKKYDKIVIGAGLYGLYAARYCAKRGRVCWFWSVILRRFAEQPILIRRGCTKVITIRDPFRRQ